MTRRAFLRRVALAGGVAGGLALAPLPRGARSEAGYGPLIPRGELWLPEGFDYRVISRQGDPMSDGRPTPGMFDGMAAFRGPDGATVLLRNHENRGRSREVRVEVPEALRHDADPRVLGGVTRLVVRRDRSTGLPVVVESYAVLGGTIFNCSGGVLPGDRWVSCEEIVTRSGPTDTRHGYCFEVDAGARGPVAAAPARALGRFVHEAVAWQDGVLYQTEDRDAVPDGRHTGRLLGACFYRFLPDGAVVPGRLAEVRGTLQALRVRREFHADLAHGRCRIGQPLDVEWVTIDEPDHRDDSDERMDRAPGFTPVRVQAQDQGAAFFTKLEGMCLAGGKVLFTSTDGGSREMGQVWEYDPRRETLTLRYESASRDLLDHPDNIAAVPHTGDVLLQEDGRHEEFVRGLTPDGVLYDFCRSEVRRSEFCGACFDPGGEILYLNQRGESKSDRDRGGPSEIAVTYAIWGPFERRRGARA